jgi:AAA family ATP:ADP antiporter
MQGTHPFLAPQETVMTSSNEPGPLPQPARGLSRAERLKVALLSTWFFSSITALWLLKPVRTASLLAHLGATELPYLRFGTVLAVALVVLGYSRVVNRFSRLDVVRGMSAIFALVLALFWLALQLGGAALGAQRWFVWAVFIMVDVYSTLMVTIFWTYANDVVSRAEADRLYGPIGVGGILGGVAGGAIVDAAVASVGPVNLLLVCAAIVLLGGGLGWLTEHVLAPPPRQMAPESERSGGPSRRAEALDGAREVLRSRYLQWIVAIVLAYEFAAAVTDFAINVVFERTLQGEVAIAQMYGRLGWIVSGTALLAQLVLVPLLLPRKRLALLIPPLVMTAATVGLAVFPVLSIAIVLAAGDRGLNYSLQQVTKETLYVPLSDAQKYKAKAFIDVFVDRAGKALSSVVLLVVIARRGVSLVACLVVALVALGVWVFAAAALGRAYRSFVAARATARETAPEPADRVEPSDGARQAG